MSLGINYPNQSDRKKSNASNSGGDIFIHGSCVTIGCLPMTDDKIKEIYLYAVFARNNGQNDIPVYIFPFRMTDTNFQTYQNRNTRNRELTDFWANLKIGYDKFVSEKKALKVSVDNSGNYQFYYARYSSGLNFATSATENIFSKIFSRSLSGIYLSFNSSCMELIIVSAKILIIF